MFSCFYYCCFCCCCSSSSFLPPLHHVLILLTIVLAIVVVTLVIILLFGNLGFTSKCLAIVSYVPFIPGPSAFILGAWRAQRNLTALNPKP